MKTYAWIFNLFAVAVVVGAIAYSIINYGDNRYQEGKDEIQAVFDKHKADKKAEADKQAADTEKLNKENNDALLKSQASGRDARINLNIALERLRDIPVMQGEGYLPLAGSGCSKASVSGLAANPSGIGISVEQRIGSCENSGSESCFIARSIFDRSMIDAKDRELTRKWAIGQGIKIVGDAN